jgi:hypothetical protein
MAPTIEAMLMIVPPRCLDRYLSAAFAQLNEVPVLFLHPQDEPVPRDARVVHEDVDSAELLHDLVDHGRYFSGRGDIGLEREGFSSPGGNIRRGFLRGFQVYVTDGDISAVGCKAHRYLPADALCRAGDKRCLSGETHLKLLRRIEN